MFVTAQDDVHPGRGRQAVEVRHAVIGAVIRRGPARVVPRQGDAAVRVDRQLRREPLVLRRRHVTSAEGTARRIQLVETPTPPLEPVPGGLPGPHPGAEHIEVRHIGIDVFVIAGYGIRRVEQPSVRGQVAVGEVDGTAVVLRLVTETQQHPAVRDQFRRRHLIGDVGVLVLVAPAHVPHGVRREGRAGRNVGLQPRQRRGRRWRRNRGGR